MSIPETLPLRLTARQKDILLQAAGLPGELQEKLQSGLPEDDMLVFECSRDDLNDLAEFAAGEANHATDPRLEAEYEAILRRIEGLLNIAGPVPRGTEPVVPEPLLHALKELVQDPSVISFDDLIARAEEVVAGKINTPQADLEGLTPLQSMRLVESHWLPEGAAVLLNIALPYEEVSKSSVFNNARLLLEIFRDEGPVKATQSGNLMRRFIEGLLDRLDLPEWYRKMDSATRKSLNEIHVYPLHMARVLLETAGLVELEGGRFSVTLLGRDLVSEERAGDLYARLFYALYRQVNLDYFDRMVEVPAIQEGAAYSLYVVSRLADDWVREDDLAQRVFLPYVRQSIPENPHHTDLPANLAHVRIFHHLQDFALLERREVPDSSAPLGSAGEVRKTPLYDAFIRFDLNEE